jgi:hypothetical protein
MTDTRSTPQDDELPGMLAVAKGVAEQRFPHTMDAAVWAAEFVKLNPGADEGLMLSWFANAIMAGYDTARYTRSESAAWVACSERMPEYGPNNDDVLAYTLTGHVITVHPNRIHTLRESAKRDSEDCFYTHWMPLPKGPK